MRRTVLSAYLAGVPVLCFVIGFLHSRISATPYAFGTQNSFGAYVGLAAIHLVTALIAGIPSEEKELQPIVLASVLAASAATSAWLILQAIWPGLLPRWVVFVSTPALGLWGSVCGSVSSQLQRRSGERERVFAIVDERDVALLMRDSERTFPMPEESFTLVGVVALQEFLATPSTHLDTGNKKRATLIVLGDSATLCTEVIDLTTELHRTGIKVRTLGDFYEQYFGKVSLSDLTRLTMLFDVRSLHNASYRRLKRGFDLIAALFGAIACLVVLPLVVLGNLVGNRGPILYRQDRIGRGGKKFMIVKFRTMKPDPDATFPIWTQLSDPRVTSFGRVLRRTHIDELPQWWNMLVGHLSVVGPRPEQPHYVDELAAKEASYLLRHLVMPGLTGWAQVKNSYAATEAEAIEKLQFDLFYLRNQSATLDLRIVTRTFRSIVRHRGR
jgi:lipopolysaccharide/colanic/teichoic acid biosynthesis glycosyltransferase